METIEYKGLSIKIEQDDMPINPRNDYDHLGILACLHKRYDLGDTHDMDVSDLLAIEASDAYISLPVYLYDHSGITISTTPFSCQWDSGKIGVIFCTVDKAQKEGMTVEKVKEYLKGEVEAYDKYLTGDIWFYSVESPDGVQLDSCGGFYGYEYCLEQAKEQASWWHSELIKQAKKEEQELAWYNSQL